MTHLDLLRAALQIRNQQGLQRMILQVKRKSSPRTDRICLAGAGSPLGHVVGSTDARTYQVAFDVDDVIRWASAHVSKAVAFMVPKLATHGIVATSSNDGTFTIALTTVAGEPIAELSLEDACSFALWLSPAA